MSTKPIRTLATLAVASMLTATPGLVGAQSPQPGESQTMKGHASSEGRHASQPEGSMADCQQMQEKMQKMHASSDEMQATAEGLVKRMNEASGEEQQKAMAELLTALVEQRQTMHDMMAKMQPMMMQHMMAHMHPGDGGGGAMAGCPMMKGAEGEEGDPKSGDHSAHH